MKLYQFLAASLALAAAAAAAQEARSLQSDWIEFVKGYKGATLGVEVREIASNEAEGTQTITLAVPRDAISHPDQIEEVVVRARGPEPADEPRPLPVKYEWVSDYDADNYGLVIHLGEGNWPIRLYMNSAPGYTR